MTLPSSRVSRNNATEYSCAHDLPSINPQRQYLDVSNVGKSAISNANQTSSSSSLLGRVKNWFGSCLPAENDNSDAESSASSSDSDLSPSNSQIPNVVPMKRDGELNQVPAENSVESNQSLTQPLLPPNSKAPSTAQLCYELHTQRSKSYETELQDKALHQENEQKSQQMLLRALKSLKDLPEKNLSEPEKKRAFELIKVVTNEGLEWTGGVWKDKIAKQNLEEEVQMKIDDKQSSFPLLTNKYMQISQAKNEFSQMCIGLIKTLNDSTLVVIRAMGR